MRIACQAATWEMFGEQWAGRVDDILDAIASAGYEGVEFGHKMIREYAGRQADLARAVRARGLRFAAYSIALGSGGADPARREGDLVEAECALRFVEAFPEALLVLEGATSEGDENIDRKIAIAAELYNEIGRRGQRTGVRVALHPNSQPGSILRSRESYRRIMDLTDPGLVGWAVDTGEIFRSGQIAIEAMAYHRSRIGHVHLRDVGRAGQWRPLGQGVGDISAAIGLLAESDYQDWLVVEEQSIEAWTAPDRSIVIDLQYAGRFALG
jgi:inosose dehydratase